jgi:hypothetical protein
MQEKLLLFRLLRGRKGEAPVGGDRYLDRNLPTVVGSFTYGGRNITTESGRYPLNEEMVPMPNSPDDPASTSSRSTATRTTEDPAPHLVCAYSPRWLSGPTPSFEGLVATWSPTDEHESDSR